LTRIFHASHLNSLSSKDCISKTAFQIRKSLIFNVIIHSVVEVGSWTMIWLIVGLAAVADDTHALDPSVWCSDPANALGGYCLDYFAKLRNQTTTSQPDSVGPTVPLPTTSTSIQDDENIPTTASATAPRPVKPPSTTVNPVIEPDDPVIEPVDPAIVPHDNFVRLAL
jgi:hypothetical protein